MCAALALEMKFSETYAEFLKERFAQWGREMPSSNLRQAEYPAGAELLANPKGTAPGLVLAHDGKLIFLLPGVPWRWLPSRSRGYAPAPGKLPRSRCGCVQPHPAIVGPMERQIGEMLDRLFTGTPTFNRLIASAGEIKVRITAKARQ